MLGLEEAAKQAELQDAAAVTSVVEVVDSDDSDDELLVEPVSPGPGRGWGELPGEEGGWGECPVCEQLLPLDKLQLHAMACQGLHLNGGEGLEVKFVSLDSVAL